MRELSAKFIILITDIVSIILSLYLAFVTREHLTISSLPPFQDSIYDYITFYPVIVVPVILFVYEGIYTYRYDFWHESRLLIKALISSMIIIFAYLAMSKSVEDYSRIVLTLSFIYMIFIIPFFKRVVKHKLYDLGLWRKVAKFYSDNESLEYEIEKNHYLGYIKTNSNRADTVFINSKDMSVSKLQSTIDEMMKRHKEVLFIPILNDFDLTQSRIYELSNIRSNFISLKNRLKSRFRRAVKYIFDYILAVLSLPVTLPVIAITAILIKKEDIKAPIFFNQKRIGKDGKIFVCYKFRTMIPDNEKIFLEYINSNPQEAEYYHKYRKLKNDPRVTKIGKILRSTSIDELPQILNVLKGDMSLVGPRPYLPEEKDIMDGYYTTITNVKPGITGLWQVSGRNDIDFHQRVLTDVWYIRNWNLWLDITIILKTIKVVLDRRGAY